MQKAIHISIIIVIISAIIFTGLILILKYDEKGEINIPFQVSKITIISSTNAESIEDDKNLWNKAIGQDNDIYIYIKKNKEYKKEETIKEVKVQNIKVLEKPQKGEITTYRPSTSEKEIFQNKEEYKIEELIFEGTQKTNIQSQEISNQGGIIAFRCATQRLGNFISNEKEINYNQLLKKINITYEQIKAKVSFDLSIVLGNNKEYKTNIVIDLPIEEVIERGIGSKEIIDLNLIFKREEK